MNDKVDLKTQQNLPEELGAALMFQIIQVACLGNERDLAAIGITREDAVFLARLTVQQQLFLQKHIGQFARFDVQMDVLRRMSERAKECCEEEQLQDAMIKHDATQPLMQKWFGMGPVEYRQRARRLGHTILRGRRQTILPEEQERRVRKAWFRDYRDVPELQRYVLIAREVNVSVTAIVAAISETAVTDAATS